MDESNDLQPFILFNSILVTIGQWEGGNERLHATEVFLQCNRFPPRGVWKSGLVDIHANRQDSDQTVQKGKSI